VPLFAEGRRLAYLRHLEGKRLLVLLNAGDESWDLNMPVNDHFLDGIVFDDLLGGGGAVVEEGHLRKGRLDSWQGAVLKPQS
jgi:hypothetical protein